MHLDGTQLRLSASDLAKHLACDHLVELERATAEGRLKRPHRHDPGLELLQERGLAHERAYVDSLRAEGRDIPDLRDVNGHDAVSRTLTAMREGHDVILQPPLRDGRWGGRADMLLRIEFPSDLGPWSYEVVDTKLSQKTRGGTVLQLCLYTDIVANIQGLSPTSMHVVKPGEGLVTESFRFGDFAAYYRLVRRRLERQVDCETPIETYPIPVPHCDICPWRQPCNERRRGDDHLSLVAGMQALHRQELERQQIITLEQFADREQPLPEPPERGAWETYERLHGQARVQLQGRREEAPVYELLPVEPDRGLALLPAPSPGDLFFDIEGDPFVDGCGLEYLFGLAYRSSGGSLEYRALWGFDRPAERRAFENLIDLVMERWRDDPAMHVYHFAPYEPSAVKRLIGRHATRESEVDQLLRGGRFVDLHAAVRQGVRASVERYSLKDLEAFTGFSREVALPEANASLWSLARDLELGSVDDVTPDDAKTVEGYNRDDCMSTEVLQAWLERLREEHERNGTYVPRPEERTGDASAEISETEARVQALFEKLVQDLPEDRSGWGEVEQARWLLAHLLDYFRREDKSAWWEFFRLHELEHEELLGERKTVTGLRFEARVGGTDRCPIHRYGFPAQEAALTSGGTLHEVGGQRVGTANAIDQAARTLDIKKRGAAAEVHPAAILVEERVSPKPMDTSILAFAESVLEHGVDGDGPFRAARDLLLAKKPRLLSHQAGDLQRKEESAVKAAERLVMELDHGVLAIQGPPGSGKTFTGGRMIAALAAKGMRVGVTAVGHKVIRNLLDNAIKLGGEAGLEVRAVHKVGHREGQTEHLEEVQGNPEALRALDAGKVVGGTTWLWSRDDAVDALDYLFVDEAGQLSLAQILAAGRSAKNLVLLGDPQQLEQPQQGTHPEGAERSALEHILNGVDTMPRDQGLFLDRTWRLHPEICRFTSELFYEGRLESREGLEFQGIEGTGRIRGSGLFYCPVMHRGNQNTSTEEVDVVERIVRSITADGATWTDGGGNDHPMTLDDVLIVAPYNAHVGALSRRLSDARIGTVDKFQGQEAPIVIYSMASSSVDEAPRGLEFLFDPHRFNVATSRARCVCVVVGSPALLEPDCRTPEHMRWANALCRFVELSRHN